MDAPICPTPAIAKMGSSALEPCACTSSTWIGTIPWCSPVSTSGRNVPASSAPTSTPPRSIASVAPCAMASEIMPPNGCSSTIASVAVISVVSSGLRISSSDSGRRARSRFSIQHISATTSSTAITPPRPGTSGSPNSVIFASAGLESIPAITPPSAVEPPNTRAVFTPTRIFIMVKIALPKIAASPRRLGYCVAISPTISGRLMMLITPVISPDAINAGISGINTFASWRSASLSGA
ncbi:Uncharacterised protein [Klebsiella pneumoniae]|nr:Uncharacterised protein [Klebsiella pneumoniae]